MHVLHLYVVVTLHLPFSQMIPRLQLLSALLLSRLVVSVSNSSQSTLSQLKVQCYVDSQISLYWIRGTNREWKPFVQNMANEIRWNVHPSLRSHCPGISNPCRPSFVRSHNFGADSESTLAARTRMAVCRRIMG